MKTSVVVVESPAKAKTINKYLGREYKVMASFGHVRDLPSRANSVLPEEDFSMSWAIDSKSRARLNDIAVAVKASDKLILATDPDREGEAISWHVLEVLKQKKALKNKPVERVVFNAITKKSVLDAMKNPRKLDDFLVNAYLARRALDYLVGFTLSPVLWRKLPGARSAGRVQSVALRLICDREQEIETFKPIEYWSVNVILSNRAGQEFEARIAEFEGKKVQRHDITDEINATTIKNMLENADFNIANIESKPVKRNPAAPFTTSTLQMDASAKLGFSASRAMQTAQRLYEGVDIGGETVGLITYMRTDGVQIAPEAIPSIRAEIARSYGDNYLPDRPRHYSTRAKNAQEAHEAIRPTEISRLPGNVAAYLDEDQNRLYDLIWRRTMASQMASANIERTGVDIEAVNNGQKAMLRANGSVIRFDGFLKTYEITQSKKDNEQDDRQLPPLEKGESATCRGIEAKQHFTEPSPRYSEASLIKKMEELGIGRPSTYASTLATLQNRDYVSLEKKRLVPASKGRVVTSFLESFFNRYVEYDFTASLEEKLDKISAGGLKWKDVLTEFWDQFSGSVEDIEKLRISEVLEALNMELSAVAFPEREDGENPRSCPKCGNGRLSLKVGRFGAFVGCSNYPECNFTRQLGGDNEDNATMQSDDLKILGMDTDANEEISLRSGRFGPYVQRGEGKQAKRAGLPKNWAPSDVDLKKAMLLLSLPRQVGTHPETGKPISAGLGRYGPFLLHDGVYANLDSPEEIFSIGINRAVDALAEKAAKKSNGGRGGATLREFGDHPDLAGPVTLKNGRYGPYVNHGKVNATLPKDRDPASITLAEAVELLAAKSHKSGNRKSRAKSKVAAKKKAAAKK